MTRLARSLAAATLAALLAGALLAGCSLKHVGAPATGVPHTIIFVQGPVDTVNHIVHLFWFGTESNGYISGYEIRMLNPADTVAADTLWGFTTRTDSTFTIRTPNGFISTVFEARAIDEHGVRDPNPAVQRFNFSNQPPIVKLVGKPNHSDLSDTTFASVTVTWTATDIDGDAGKVRPLIWLDGRSQSPDFVPAGTTSFTLPSSRFLVNGVYTTGPRTLYIQGIDDGGMAGPIDSVTWYVKQPVTGSNGRGRLLLVDEVPTSYGAKVRVDTLYANAIAATGVAPGQWRTLHLQFDQPFRSPQDMTQTFQLYDFVIWYHGEQTNISPVLMNYGDGIGPYLDSGGKLYLEALNMFTYGSNNGQLGTYFLNRYLGCDGLFQFPQAPDSSSTWSYAATQVLQCPALVDSLQNGRIIGGMNGFVVDPQSSTQILISAPAATLSPANSIPFPLAVCASMPGGYVFIADTYPMVSATISTANFPQRSSLVLHRILAEKLGLGP